MTKASLLLCGRTVQRCSSPAPRKALQWPPAVAKSTTHPCPNSSSSRLTPRPSGIVTQINHLKTGHCLRLCLQGDPS